MTIVLSDYSGLINTIILLYMHLIYITFPKKDEAIKIISRLVKDRVVACANIYDGITSIYEWEGEVQQNQEVTAICKVPDNGVDKAIAKFTKAHPYACPCIVSVKVEKSNEDFLKWVENYNKVDY